MNVELTLAENHFEDNNNGLRYGIIQVYDDSGNYCSDYVEWFKTKQERDKVVKENNMFVTGEEIEK